MDAVGQLTAGVAYEFNNILTTVIGAAEPLAAQVKEEPSLAATVRQIDESAERGSQLVQRMLAFARKTPMETGFVDVNESVWRVVAILERTLGPQVTLETRLADDLWPIRTDAFQLED